jgi:hypothetical protein
VSVQADGNLLASSEIKAILPDVLIEYLWKLVLNEKWYAYEKQSFVLKTGELGGRDIQDIYHTCSNSNSTDTHRVYGAKPVDCVLQVLHSQGDYQMQLCANI